MPSVFCTYVPINTEVRFYRRAILPNEACWLGSATGTSLPGVGTVTLELDPGWNLLSLPVLPPRPAVPSVFEAAACAASRSTARPRSGQGALCAGPVWGWSGTAYETRAEVYPGSGVWVYAQAGAVLRLTGLTPASPRAVLRPGWNLVGPGGEIALQAGASDWGVSCWGWNCREQRYGLVERMFPGNGYWVHTAAACTLDLQTGTLGAPVR